MTDHTTKPTQSTSPQLVSIDLVSGGWVKKYLLTYKMPDGNLFQYESVSRKDTEAYRAELERTGQGKQSPDAVCIVPRTRDNKLVMIREFRYPINNWCIAFPAGLIESGENLIGAVERELREETGYRLVRDEQGEASIRTYGQAGYSSAGMSEESVQIVYALVEPNQDAEPEPTEFIQVFELPLAEVPQFLRENKTPIGIRAQLILASLTPSL